MDVHIIRVLRLRYVVGVDVSGEGPGGRLPKRGCLRGCCCIMLAGSWCCPAGRGIKAPGDKYLPRAVR